ncbi:MAG: putative C-S lyase [Bacteriovoracaceae bacterium]|nr:putative C-S lyase [Bacteriovoracaceae bacterium]
MEKDQLEKLFNSKVDRRGSNCEKYDFYHESYSVEQGDYLPLWVADMDFPSPPCVVDALKERLDHPVLGYSGTSESYFQSIINWYEKRYNVQINKNWIINIPSMIQALNVLIHTFSNPCDKVVIMPPVYPAFASVVEDTGRELLLNELMHTPTGYIINFNNLEEHFKNGAKILIFCNPQNPTGRVFTEDELMKLSKLCTRYDVLVISDEAHADIVYEGHQHIPLFSISPESLHQTITLTSPGKTFNLSGLGCGNVIIGDEKLKETFLQTANRIHLNQGNIFGLLALEVAYTKADQWHQYLLEYLSENIKLLTKLLKDNLPKAHMHKPEGTYLAWICFKEYGLSHHQLEEFIFKKTRVLLSSGKFFGSCGDQFMRINLATPRSNIHEAITRISSTLC